MDGADRRKVILQILAESDKPVSGLALSKKLNVSNLKRLN